MPTTRNPDHITVLERGDRLDAYCAYCDEGTNVPNKGMGRAIIAAWKTQHQHLSAVSP